MPIKPENRARYPSNWPEIRAAILLARAGESFQLSSTPIWVRPIAMALAVRGGDTA